MTDESISFTVRDSVLQMLLRRPEAVFAALDDEGWRIPVPDQMGLREHQPIPLPPDPATMIDVVARVDGYAVVGIWDRARTKGLASGAVRLRTDPNRTLTMTIIDLRHMFGTYLAALSTVEADADGAAPIPGTSMVPSRPRTAQIVKDRLATITAVDERACRMLGWQPDHMVGLKSSEFVHPDDRDRALAAWMEMLSKQQTHRVRLRHLCADGSWRWVEIENVYQRADQLNDVMVVSQLSDISDEMAAYEAVDHRERLFRRLAESMPAGLLQLDQTGAVVYANARLVTLLGVDAAATLDDHLATVATRDRPAIDAAFRSVREHGNDQQLEVEIRLRDTGERRRCGVTLVALTDQEGIAGALACFTDVTDSARLREELRMKATFDPLTGCYNRASVLAALDHAIATDDRPPAVIFIDLDEFKPVNDILGHAAGDELLVHVATNLGRLQRHDDIVGRLGGDEFLLVCRHISGPDQAMTIADRVRDLLHQDVPLSTGTVPLRASIGVAVGELTITGEELVDHADQAMYSAKREGNSQPVLFTHPPSA